VTSKDENILCPNFFSLLERADKETKINIAFEIAKIEKPIPLLKRIAQIWCIETKQNIMVREEKDKRINTLTTRISGHEDFIEQIDAKSKVMETLKIPEHKERNPSYFILKSFPGRGKTRTLGEMIQSAMNNNLFVNVEDPLMKMKLSTPYGSFVTNNDLMNSNIINTDSCLSFLNYLSEAKTGKGKIEEIELTETQTAKAYEIDLIARICFW
jgi:hypothetical protein